MRLASEGTGVAFAAGPGVGIVTRPGLPIPPGEPAVNPVPRAMIRAALAEAAGLFSDPCDVVVEIAVPGGERLAARTLDARLGIVGGLPILGTAGVVVPCSCAAWIDTIHRGIDVARAMGLPPVAGATGATSEVAVQALHGLPDPALIEMGDFVVGMLKYLRRHPVARVTVAGGVAKMSKLGQGLLDLHSRRREVDRDWLAARVRAAGADAGLTEVVRTTNTAAHAFTTASGAGLDLGSEVARAAWRPAAGALGPGVRLDVALVDRGGAVVGRTEALPTA